jgi:hypothetical protein
VLAVHTPLSEQLDAVVQPCTAAAKANNQSNERVVPRPPTTTISGRSPATAEIILQHLATGNPFPACETTFCMRKLISVFILYTLKVES